MLGMDGHIQLADMGGVGDCIGDMSARKVSDSDRDRKTISSQSTCTFGRALILGGTGQASSRCYALIPRRQGLTKDGVI